MADSLEELKSVPRAVATGYAFPNLDAGGKKDPVATALGTDLITTA